MLLSNGNLVATEATTLSAGGEGQSLGTGRRWEDPFPKPSYLFAMVAAKLDKLEDSFVTRSGRTVKPADLSSSPASSTSAASPCRR